MAYVKACLEIYAVLQEPDSGNLCEYLINGVAALGDRFAHLQQPEKRSG